MGVPALCICNIRRPLHPLKNRHCTIFFYAGSILRGLPVDALLGEHPGGDDRWTLWPSINVPDWTIQHVRTAAQMLTCVPLRCAGSILRGLPVHALWGEHPGGGGCWTMGVPALQGPLQLLLPSHSPRLGPNRHSVPPCHCPGCAFAVIN